MDKLNTTASRRASDMNMLELAIAITLHKLNFEFTQCYLLLRNLLPMNKNHPSVYF